MAELIAVIIGCWRMMACTGGWDSRGEHSCSCRHTVSQVCNRLTVSFVTAMSRMTTPANQHSGQLEASNLKRWGRNAPGLSSRKSYRRRDPYANPALHHDSGQGSGKRCMRSRRPQPTHVIRPVSDFLYWLVTAPDSTRSSIPSET